MFDLRIIVMSCLHLQPKVPGHISALRIAPRALGADLSRSKEAKSRNSTVVTGNAELFLQSKKKYFRSQLVPGPHPEILTSSQTLYPSQCSILEQAMRIASRGSTPNSH